MGKKLYQLRFPLIVLTYFELCCRVLNAVVFSYDYELRVPFFWVILCLARCVAVPNDDFKLRYLFVVLYCHL